MWLFIPSNCVLESECSEKVSAPHSSILDSNIEPFVTWSGKPVQPANLSRLWKRERSMRHLSGLTCERSIAQRGADAFIASLPVFHAKTYRLRGSGPVSTESVRDSSSTFAASPTIAVRDSSFWRTSQASLLPPPPLWTKPKASSTNARPPESWENWPTAAGMRNGRIYARPTSVPITNAIDGSASHGGTWLTPFGMSGIEAETGKVGAGGEFAKQVHQWQTPTTMAAKGVEYQRQPDGSNLAILSGQAQQWATPDANALERTNRSDSPNAKVRPTLALAAAQWSTQNVPNGGRSVSAEVVASRGKTENGKRQVGLESEVRHWATPRATDGEKGGPNCRGGRGDPILPGQACQQMISLRPVHSTLDGRELSPTARTLRRRLNPAFTCWLMGWPIWWTNPAITNSVKPETELWRSKLQSQLSRLLGEPESFEEAA